MISIKTLENKRQVFKHQGHSFAIVRSFSTQHENAKSFGNDSLVHKAPLAQTLDIICKSPLQKFPSFKLCDDNLQGSSTSLILHLSPSR